MFTTCSIFLLLTRLLNLQSLVNVFCQCVSRTLHAGLIKYRKKINYSFYMKVFGVLFTFN